MKKITSLIFICFLLIGCQNAANSNNENQPQTKRPNILLIVADDLGYSDIGAFGGEISTPNIDQLAYDGVRMSNFYTAATCSPTRSMLLGGVDNHKAGLGSMVSGLLPSQKGKKGYETYMNFDVVSVAKLLQDAGYGTYMTGKWHIGVTEELSPKARGFDKSFALLQGGAGHFDNTSMVNFAPKATFRENGKLTSLPDDFYSSEFYTDKLMEYLAEDEGDDKPFFAYLAYTAPHWPLQAPQDYIDKYSGVYDNGYNVLRSKRIEAMQNLGLVAENATAHPSYETATANWENLTSEEKKTESRKMEIYAAMVDNMDFQIGRLLEYLKKTGQRDNTIIIFMSDNGAEGADKGKEPVFPQEWIDANFDNSFENMGHKGSYIYYGAHWAEASVGPARMYKSYTTEAGIKAPAIINYSDKFGTLKGQISNQFMTVLDLAPTFLEIAETEHPGSKYEGREVHEYTGKSLMPYLFEKDDTVHGDDFVMGWEIFQRPAIRKGDWKILKLPKPLGTGEWELFNLADDPAELVDLSKDNPNKMDELLKAWAYYVEENNVIMIDE